MSFKKVSVLILIVFTASLLLFIFKIRKEMVDFEVNYEAAQRLRLGETLYRLADEHYQFKYMPVSSFFYLPLTLLPLEWAKACWFFAVLSFSLGLVFLSNKTFAPRVKLSWPLFILPPLILLKFFFRELQLGQINSLVTLILLAMVWLLSDEKNTNQTVRDFWSGLCWGLAVALKPYALIFFPYFIVKKKWISLLSGLGILAIAFLAPSLYYGFEGNLIVHQEWISTFSQSTPTLITSQDNVSLIAFFSKWIGNQSLSLLLTGVILTLLAILILFLILRGKKLPRASVLECSVLLICIPLVSPLGWDYTFLMAILGLTIILSSFHTYSRPWKIFLAFNFCIIAFSLYDLLGREAYATFMSWSVLTLNFLILIGYLSFLRIRRII